MLVITIENHIFFSMESSSEALPHKRCLATTLTGAREARRARHRLVTWNVYMQIRLQQNKTPKIHIECNDDEGRRWATGRSAIYTRHYYIAND